jgi:ATP-dependent 26S proteasome regulatory subunit
MTRQLLEKDGRNAAGPDDLKKIFRTFATDSRGATTIQLQTIEDGETGAVSEQKENAFDSVGGTDEAKKALQDALLLDYTKRALLESWGIDSPVGVLLYGPPGCGMFEEFKPQVKSFSLH